MVKSFNIKNLKLVTETEEQEIEKDEEELEEERIYLEMDNIKGSKEYNLNVNMNYEFEKLNDIKDLGPVKSLRRKRKRELKNVQGVVYDVKSNYESKECRMLKQILDKRVEERRADKWISIPINTNISESQLNGLKNYYRMKLADEILEKKKSEMSNLNDYEMEYKIMEDKVFRGIKDIDVWKKMVEEKSGNIELLKLAVLETESDEFIDKLILLSNDFEITNMSNDITNMSTVIPNDVTNMPTVIPNDVTSMPTVIPNDTTNMSNDVTSMSNDIPFEIFYNLYLRLKGRNVFLDKIIIFLLNIDNKKNESVWYELFRSIDIKRSIKILESLNKGIPECIYKNVEVNEFLKNIPLRVYEDIPLYLKVFFCYVLNLESFDESLFYECYDVMKNYCLNLDFINTFFINKIDSYSVDLLKAKEVYKLLMRNYIDNKDISLLKTVDKILNRGIIKYPEYKKDFNLARSKVYYSLKDYTTSYSILKKIRNPGIRKFIVLSKISLNICEKELKSNLKSQKLYLLYIEVLKALNLNCIGAYEDAMKKYQSDEKIALSYLRYIRFSELDEIEKAVIFDNFILKFNKSELIWYETYLFYKKINKIKKFSLILKNASKLFKSDLINMELSFIENKNLNLDNKYYLYYEIRKEEFDKNKILIKLKSSKNGDCLLFWYYLERKNVKEIEKVANFLELKNGFYWSQVYESLMFDKFEDKLEYGLRLLKEDLFFEKSTNLATLK